MTTRQITEMIYDQSLRSVNFFNGRLLTAEDLSKEQAGSREERRRLGRALGAGVAWGLEVSMTAGADQVREPSVTITPGLAIDRRGQTLLLEETVDLALKVTPTRAATGGITAFQMCRTQDEDAYVAGAGLYLLTLTSGEGREGRALVSGLGNVEASCNTRYHVPGLQFRLTQFINLQLPNDRDRLRNWAAYRCFGSEEVFQSPYANPFGPRQPSYGLIDSLRPNRLADCEVPLALVYWTSSGGLVFVDMWAARRRLTPTEEAAAGWPRFMSDRHASEAEAMFQQFQAQLEDLRKQSVVANALQAKAHFRYVPPAGIIPLRNAREGRGYDETLFFQGIPRHPMRYIEGARLEYLLRASFAYPPLDLDSGVMVWIYRVRENAEAIQNNVPNPPQPFLVYASGHMPYLGDPHYDVNRAGYSNFADQTLGGGT